MNSYKEWLVEMTQSNVRQILQVVLSKFPCSSQQINSGQCDSWVAEAHHALDGAGIDSDVWSTADWDDDYSHDDDHMFLQIGMKFYDAESLSGINKHTDLPFYKRRFAEKGKFPPVVQLT